MASITTRAAKGSPLTHSEVDANFTNLNADKLESSTAAATYAPKAGPTFTGVVSVAAGTAAAPSVVVTGDTDTGLYAPGANQLGIATGGSERLRIDSTGQIESAGLGTASSPAWSFVGDPNTGLYSPGADQLAISTVGTGRLFVDASGNVGVGATPAGSIFDVSQSGTSSAGTVIRAYNRTDGANQGYLGLLKFGSTASTYGAYTANSVGINSTFTQLNIGTETAHALVAYTNNTERLRIDSSGRLLVGTSADSGGALLQINGDRICVATAKTPSSSTATGTAGEICWDANYIYVCTAANTWKRSALTTW